MLDLYDKYDKHWMWICKIKELHERAEKSCKVNTTYDEICVCDDIFIFLMKSIFILSIELCKFYFPCQLPFLLAFLSFHIFADMHNKRIVCSFFSTLKTLKFIILRLKFGIGFLNASLDSDCAHFCMNSLLRTKNYKFPISWKELTVQKLDMGNPKKKMKNLIQYQWCKLRIFKSLK